MKCFGSYCDAIEIIQREFLKGSPYAHEQCVNKAILLGKVIEALEKAEANEREQFEKDKAEWESHINDGAMAGWNN